MVGAVTAVLWLSSMPARPPAPGVEVGRALAGVIHGSDRVVVVGLWQLEIQHGLAEGFLSGSRAAPAQVRVETVPRSQGDHPGWLDIEAFSPVVLRNEAKALASDARFGGGRIWLVWSPSLPWSRLSFQYSLVGNGNRWSLLRLSPLIFCYRPVQPVFLNRHCPGALRV